MHAITKVSLDSASRGVVRRKIVWMEEVLGQESQSMSNEATVVEFVWSC